MLSNAYFLAKIHFDTAENEPAKNLQNLQNLLIFPILLTLTLKIQVRSGGALRLRPLPGPGGSRGARQHGALGDGGRRRRRAALGRHERGDEPVYDARDEFHQHHRDGF